eukprot:938970-Pyramimonas_sp.AAC.1
MGVTLSSLRALGGTFGCDTIITLSLQVWQQMRRDGVVPNFKTHAALITACERCGQWQQALKVRPIGPS